VPDFPPSHQTVVDVRAVEKSFGDGPDRIHVLKQVNLSARTGEIMMLVGPSGCGKTTLLSAIAGTLRVESGTINVFGNELEKMSGGALTRFRAKNIGFIFQQFNLIPTLTVAENVGIPLLIQGVSSSVALKRSREVLEKVGLGPRWKERPNKLSGGQQQRVAIARAPDRAVIIVTHDNRIFSYADRIARMDDGEIVEVTEQGHQQPPHFLHEHAH
jgi:putative ABC transport system ATP-binding protein